MENNINENSIVNQKELLGSIDKIMIKSSLAYRVSDFQPLSAPVGIVSGAKWDKVTGKLTIEQSDVVVVSEKIQTEFTLESMQDLQSIYKEGFMDVVAHYVVDELMYKIDARFISMIKTRAIEKTSLVFDSTFDTNMLSVGRSIAINVQKGLADLPISDNRSPQGWAIVSSNVASILSVTVGFDTEDLDDNSPSYLGRIAGTDYYIDYTHPNDGVDNVAFGIKGNGISKGSTIFSPYTRTWLDSINPDSGELSYFLLDRTAMTINPLDEKYYNAGAGSSAFLGKFDVDITALKAFL